MPELWELRWMSYSIYLFTIITCDSTITCDMTRTWRCLFGYQPAPLALHKYCQDGKVLTWTQYSPNIICQSNVTISISKPKSVFYCVVDQTHLWIKFKPFPVCYRYLGKECRQMGYLILNIIVKMTSKKIKHQTEVAKKSTKSLLLDFRNVYNNWIICVLPC